MPQSVTMPEPSRKPTFGFTPVAATYRSAVSSVPSARRTPSTASEPSNAWAAPPSARVDADDGHSRAVFEAEPVGDVTPLPEQGFGPAREEVVGQGRWRVGRMGLARHDDDRRIAIERANRLGDGDAGRAGADDHDVHPSTSAGIPGDRASADSRSASRRPRTPARNGSSGDSKSASTAGSAARTRSSSGSQVVLA